MRSNGFRRVPRTDADIGDGADVGRDDYPIYFVRKRRFGTGSRSSSARGLDAAVTAPTDRREALGGADCVLSVITVGGREPFENEIRIPERYGVEQTIGDTASPDDIFRGLRTIPTLNRGESGRRKGGRTESDENEGESSATAQISVTRSYWSLTAAASSGRRAATV
nr:hypothetical protein [Halopelagius longus]